MSDLIVIVLVGVLALSVPLLSLWAIWRIARQPLVRQRTLALVLVVCAGVVLLGVVLPPAIMALGLDPFIVWLPYALLAVACAAVVGWRWSALTAETWRHPGVYVTGSVLLALLVLAGVAVT